MLAGTLDWNPPPREDTSEQPVSEPAPQEFRPAPHAQRYQRPPKARAERKRAGTDSLDNEALHTGDAREIVGAQPRRAPTVQTLHDPGLRRVSGGVLAKPKPKKAGDLSDDPTWRLQAMLRKS